MSHLTMSQYVSAFHPLTPDLCNRLMVDAHPLFRSHASVDRREAIASQEASPPLKAPACVICLPWLYRHPLRGGPCG